jgi:hypothetical protein
VTPVLADVLTCDHLTCRDRARWLVYAWYAGQAPAPMDEAVALHVCGLHAKCWPFDYLLPFYQRRVN